MIPKFRAWHKIWNRMEEVVSINFNESFIKTTYKYEIWLFDDIELMQCIGEDREGNEVFEGDILKSLLYNKGQKWFIELNQILSASCGYNDSSPIQGWHIKESLDGCIKIGNIFEHPELLEKA